MSEERAERCENCRFRVSLLILDPDGRWRPKGASHDGLTEVEYDESHDDASGECHRYPPITTDGLFPDVRVDNWCGEWKAKEVAGKEIELDPILSQRIEVLDLPTREKNILDMPIVVFDYDGRKTSHVNTLSDLIALSADDLLQQHNFGSACLANVRAALAAHGLKLRGD